MKPIFAIALLIAVSCTTANAQKPKAQKFTPKQIHAGAELYEDNCSTCHGEHMADPGMAFDLRTFPYDQHDRFVNSVSNGEEQHARVERLAEARGNRIALGLRRGRRKKRPRKKRTRNNAQ